MECELAAGRIMWPLWGVLVIGMGVAAVNMGFGCVALGGTPFFPNYVITSLLTPFILTFTSALLLLFVVRQIVESCGLEGERAATDYSVGEYVRKCLVGALLCAITLGVYTPWFVAKMTKYLLGGISFKGVKFGFQGSGFELFAIVTLSLILPLVILALLFNVAVFSAPFRESLTTLIVGLVIFLFAMVAVCALGYSLLARWMLKVNYGERLFSTNFTTLGATLFVIEQVALTIITLGLYAPMMSLRIVQYFLSATCVGEGRDCVRIGMRLRSWRDWAYVWGQLLLTIVTLGIYIPWFYTRIFNRFVPRIYLDSQA